MHPDLCSSPRKACQPLWADLARQGTTVACDFDRIKRVLKRGATEVDAWRVGFGRKKTGHTTANLKRAFLFAEVAPLGLLWRETRKRPAMGLPIHLAS